MHHTDIDDLAAMVESYLRTALFTWTYEDASAPYAANAEGINVCWTSAPATIDTSFFFPVRLRPDRPRSRAARCRR